MPNPSARRRRRRDDGYSLVEVLVSVAIIGTVMAAAAPFLVTSLSISDQQRDAQVAVQLANNALERVRALEPTEVLTGRGTTAVQAQFAGASAAVRPYLSEMTAVGSSNLPSTSTDGATATLPTVAVPVTMGGVTYSQEWFVGLCYQSKVALTAVVPAIGACSTTVAPLQLLRVVVAVTYQHKSCPGGTCVSVASTLVSTAKDPVFPLKTSPPDITDITAQTGYVSVVVPAVQMLSTGGSVPLTWSATGLPTGLTIDATTGTITGTPTTAGTYTVTVKVLDKQKRSDTSKFTWTIVPVPTLATPGNQVGRVGAAISPLALVASGGRAPLTYTATNLPTGLTLNASTGVVSGTPTRTGTWIVDVKVADAGTPALIAVTSFTWSVYTQIKLGIPTTTYYAANNGTYSYPLGGAASGGLTPYTWSADSLPYGMTIDKNTGTVSGTITRGTRYLTTITVTDAAGGVATQDVVVNVSPSSTSDFRVRTPDPGSPDQKSTVGSTVSLSATAGTTADQSSTWTAKGLPTGLSISSGGTITGKPTAAGTYKVTLTATRSGQTATLMFLWTVS